MSEASTLNRLARLHGLQTAYRDVYDSVRHSPPEAIRRVLQLLGVPIERLSEAEDLCRGCRQSHWRKPIEPVCVAWDGQLMLRVRLPAEQSRGSYAGEFALEDGTAASFSGRLEDNTPVSERSIEGVRYSVREIRPPQRLPTGYHRLTLETAAGTFRSLVLSAPRRAFSRESVTSRHRWGVFVPLYALHRESSWGAGDFSDLEAMLSWVSDQGGSVVATLPLLGWLSEIGDDPSPYSPASRLFWNEFYLDVTRTTEFDDCRGALSSVAGEEIRRGLEAARADPHVDYHKQMGLKREVLWQLAECFYQQPTRHEDFERFRAGHPDVERYAEFRAVGERQGGGWPTWPERLRDGEIRAGDYDDDVFRYHLYTQWQIERQLRGLAKRAGEKEMLWYLDFPLGVSGNGFDVWRHRDLFAQGASGGAPPDAFFSKGQSWGFPPLNPDTLRQHEYGYFIESLRRHLEYARLLRIDHVMSLHRLYWVPDGFEPRDGVYVRYRTEELFAILVIESHRRGAEIIGENLGTVPKAVDDALQTHHIREMYVAQGEARTDEEPTMRDVPRFSVASLNTHDMPPFASFWTGLDIDDRLDLGLLSDEEAATERDSRAHLRLAIADFLRRQGLLDQESLDPQDVLTALLGWLASSPSDIVLVNLEDLWEETQMQNTPGTHHERCNWRRKLRYRLEELRELPQVTRPLRIVNEKREAGVTSRPGSQP